MSKMQKQVPGFAVFHAGLSVHPSFPYLGASPDWKVFDPSTDCKYGLLEIKCPFSNKGEILDEAAADPNFHLEKVGGKFYLKKKHTCGYYAQVQKQQMAWFLHLFVRLKGNVCWQNLFRYILLAGKISSCQNYHNFICRMHWNTLSAEQD